MSCTVRADSTRWTAHSAPGDLLESTDDIADLAMLKLVLRIPGRRKVYCIGRLGHFQLQTVLHRLFPPLFGLMCLGSDSWHSAVSLLMHFEHGLFASSPHCRCLQGAHAVCDPCADRLRSPRRRLRNGLQSPDKAASPFAFGVFQKGGVVRIDEDHSKGTSRRASSRSASRIWRHSSSTSRMKSLS